MAILAIAGSLCGCDPTGSATPIDSGRDLTMLYRMIELDAAHRGMEPYLRDRSRYEELATTAEGVARIAADSLLVTYPETEGFHRDPEPWERFRATLEDAANAAAAAARAGDAEGLHRAYSRMDGSCIACHKRYLEIH